METQDAAETGGRGLKPIEWIAAVTGLLAVGTIIVVFFTVKVCDQQLAATGQVVNVCRHPQATDPLIAALGLVIVASLGVFYTEISGFGFTLKRAVEEAKRTAQEAVHEARQTSQETRETASDLAEGVSAALSQTRSPDQATSADDVDPMKQLAARYNEIRWTMPSGAARTRQMTEVMYEMISQLRNVDGFDVEGYLHSNDRGLRLAAVAYLYVNPDPAWARQLADAALSEDKPFNEYWSLQVLRMVLKGHCDALDDVTRSRLQDRLAELASTGADRAHQIRQLLRECPPRRRTTTP